MKTKSLVLAALFAALTAIGAFLKIPAGTISFTLQFFFTAMAGVLLGAKWGAVSQLVYVLLGLVGLPIFTNGGGFSYVLQPSFGFLLGLIPAAFLIGWAVEKWGKSFWSIVLACTLGLACLYVVGIPYMHLILIQVLGYEMTIWDSLYTGMIIFLPWDFVKIFVTAGLGVKLLPRLAKV